jgi:transcriptional regulator with XRE-family HTH domain
MWWFRRLAAVPRSRRDRPRSWSGCRRAFCGLSTGSGQVVHRVFHSDHTERVCGMRAEAGLPACAAAIGRLMPAMGVFGEKLGPNRAVGAPRRARPRVKGRSQGPPRAVDTPDSVPKPPPAGIWRSLSRPGRDKCPVSVDRQAVSMDDLRFGAAIRTARHKRRWRQSDLAAKAGVSEATVWRAERGRISEMTLGSIRRICAPLDIRVEVLPRGRGADLDRMLSARHAALHESVARALARDFPAWVMAPEVSFSIWGERGVIDLLLWHPGRRALLIIELKTELVDVGDLLATMDRRRRLAFEIAGERGWHPESVSTWILLAESRTNERRVADHRTVLRNAYPADGRQMRRWLADPVGTIATLSLWPEQAGARSVAIQRIRSDGGSRGPGIS